MPNLEWTHTKVKTLFKLNWVPITKQIFQTWQTLACFLNFILFLAFCFQPPSYYEFMNYDVCDCVYGLIVYFYLLRMWHKKCFNFLICYMSICICNCFYSMRYLVVLCIQCSYDLLWGDEAIRDNPISCHIHHQSQVYYNSFLENHIL